MHQYVLKKQVLTVAQKKSSPFGKQAAKELLLLGTTASISPEGKERISRILTGTVDWEYLLELAEFHGVAPLIAYNFHANSLAKRIPQPYSERLNNIYNNNLYRNVILSDELTKVLSAFNQHGIPTIILKGTILAEQLYGNPALRTVTDMDILVPPEKISLAGSLLLELGYQQLALKQTWNHPFHEAPYCKRVQFPFFIEVHRNLDDPRLVAIPQQEIWHHAQRLQIQGGTVLMLSSEDTLLYLSNNFSKPSSHILKSLCDITELLKKYGGIMDWDYIIDSAYSWQIETPTYYSLKRAQDLLGAPVPVSTINALKPSAYRWALLNSLVNREFFISTISGDKLRSETLVLFRSLMMQHIHQTLAVLFRYRGNKGWWAWLRTVTWIMMVFGAALGRNMSRVTREGV